MKADPRRTASKDAFTVDFQPRHVIRTGAVAAVEALLRWPHGRHGSTIAPPAAPSIDRAAVASHMAGVLLHAACVQAVDWRDGLRLSVRLVAEQFRGDDLCLQVASALEESGLAPERLELAIPEHIVFGFNDDTNLALAGLRDLGVNLLLDEFGHIFASLAAMQKVPLTAVKVDRVMLRNLPREEADTKIIRAAIHAAHELGLTVCADGVDSGAIKTLLEELTCDEGQGSFFSPPLSGVELGPYLHG
ncbi:EAL domain-containing protein [Acidisoma cladoniae]|uniref:EAL domain-containing protein n=1 Tax=Acidisoma cladoniae TaxID=3040935 RepID=UPI00254EB075|nr:EAL domain-containing protein [Acidisoma sp. PAMC 29798]